MATAAYTLCAVLSLACAGLLLRAWAVSRSRLLLWARSATFLAGTATLLGGLIWDAIGGHER